MQQSSKGRTDWKSLDGASEKRRRLFRLVKANDGVFHCPVSHYDHNGSYRQIKGAAESMQEITMIDFTILKKSLK